MTFESCYFSCVYCTFRSQRIIEEPEVIEEAEDEDYGEPLQQWGERRHLSVDSDEERFV